MSSPSTLMQYNAETGELVCLVDGSKVLQITEPDFARAYAISQAIQGAYNRGSVFGRLHMQKAVTQCMADQYLGTPR